MVNSAYKTVLLLAIICFFCQLKLCTSEDTNDKENVPVIYFGNILSAAFPNNTLKNFYDCLCYVEIIQCNLEFQLDTFPTKFAVTNVEQIRKPSNAIDEYTNVYMCTFPKMLPFYNSVTCNRRKLTDEETACDENVLCLSYSSPEKPPKDFDNCAFKCSQLMWTGYSSLSLTYENFGDLPQPVRNIACPAPTNATLSIPIHYNTTSGSITLKNIPFTSNNSGIDLNPNSTSADISEVTHIMRKRVKEPPLPVLNVVSIAIGVGMLLMMAGASIWCRKKETKLATTDTTPTCEVHTNGRSSPLPENPTFVINHETVNAEYQSLNEALVCTLEESNVVDECDEEGYHLIKHTSRENFRSSSRPLPPLPDVEEIELAAASNNCLKEPEPITSLPTTFSESALSSVTETSAAIVHSTLSPVPILKPSDTTTHPDSACRPRPTPHRRLVDDHQLIGVVNLRRNHPALRHHMQAKLVKTQTGELEMINVQDNLPTFTDYYSRLQLVNTGDNSESLGVVGLSEEEVQDNDSHLYFNLTKENEDNTSVTHRNWTSLGWTFSEQKPPKDNESGEFYPHIFYFGTVDLCEKASVSSSDYLTVLDIDPYSPVTCENDYLILLDVNPSPFSNKT